MWDSQQSLPAHPSVMLGGPRAHQSLDMFFPGLESSGLCGCSWCKSHSTLLYILVNPSLIFSPSSYFWDEDRCALCGAILDLWSASTTSVAETRLFMQSKPLFWRCPPPLQLRTRAQLGYRALTSPQQWFLAGENSCATPAFPSSDLIAGADPCETGQAGDREKIQRGKDEDFWDHQPFPHKFNTWWHNSICFPPACQSCEMNVILFMLPRLTTTMSFAITGCPA